MANLDGLVVPSQKSRAHWRCCLGPQRCTAREGAAGSAESGVTDQCQVTVMPAPCSCGVFTSTFSRRSRNTHVSFTPVEKNAGGVSNVLRGEECVEDRLGEVVEVEGRSRQI